MLKRTNWSNDLSKTLLSGIKKTAPKWREFRSRNKSKLITNSPLYPSFYFFPPFILFSPNFLFFQVLSIVLYIYPIHLGFKFSNFFNNHRNSKPFHLNMAAADAEKNPKEEEEEERVGGEVLYFGSTAWDTMGRRPSNSFGNLISPTRLRTLVGVDIRFVASGSGNLLTMSFF